MAWICSVPLSEANEQLRSLIEGRQGLYPNEYASAGAPHRCWHFESHRPRRLIPEALKRAFTTFGALPG
jgi:hypothetical protein